jgi:hypothetical protein
MFPELLNEHRLANWHSAVYRPRVSQNGRCLRAAVYDRLQYTKEIPDPEAMGKMEDGRIHEEDIKQKLGMLGFNPCDFQKDIIIPAKTHTGLIKGKIDFCIWIDDTGLELMKNRGIIPAFITPGKKLVEAKSLSRYAFDRLDDQPMEAHFIQTMVYLHKLIEEGIHQAVIEYKCKDTARLKEYWMEYDLELALPALEKFEQVETFAKTNTLPTRISTDQKEFPCSHCEFKEIWY